MTPNLIKIGDYIQFYAEHYSETLPPCGFCLRLSEPCEPQLPAAEARKYASLSASCVPLAAEFVRQVKRLRRERHDRRARKPIIKIDLA